MGAWIEISMSAMGASLSKVAPLVGAWIEIGYCSNRDHREEVAPLVGAWIEILVTMSPLLIILCRSPRGSVD